MMQKGKLKSWHVNVVIIVNFKNNFMLKISSSVCLIFFFSISMAQVPIYGTFKDSVYAVASDPIYNEVSILGAQIATSLNNVDLRSGKGMEIRKSIYAKMMNQNTCEEVFQLCQYDSLYLNHTYKVCKMGELSKIVSTRYPYENLPRYQSAISKEHTRPHPEVFQMYIDSH
ncbi:MAG: hypothetical protein WBP08_02155 [Saprospiraceae bacterium]